MSDDIEKDAAAVSGQHDVARFRLAAEFSFRGETAVIQNFPQIDRASDRGETMIRNDEDVCHFTHSLSI